MAEPRLVRPEPLSTEVMGWIASVCGDKRCTRMWLDAGPVTGCVGTHCSYCGEPCGSHGHPVERCPASIELADYGSPYVLDGARLR